MRNKRKTMAAAVMTTFLAVMPLQALAGKEEALNYLKEAKEKIDGQYWDDAKLNLDLAATEAADLSEADKASVLEQIKAIKSQMIQAQTQALRPKLVRAIERSIDDAKPQIGNNMFDGFIKEADEIVADESNRAILGTDAEKYQKQIATFKKLHRAKFVEEQITIGQNDLAALKAEFAEKMAEIKDPDTSPNGKESAIESLERKFAEWENWWSVVPATDPRVVELKMSVDEMKSSFTSAALAGRVKEVVETLKRAWESYQDDWAGHESETAVDWNTYKGTSGDQKIDNYGTPRSKELVERYESFLANCEEDENYQSVKDADAVKTYVASIAKTAEAARARVIAAATKVVSGAEGEAITEQNKDNYSRLEDSLRVLLTNQTGAQDGNAAALRARIVKKIQAYSDATEGAEKAREEWYKQMSSAATNKWGEISKGFETESGFDPNNAGAFKGKLIQFETDNLMGWRFKPGDFAFASTIDGLPVAGRYSPDVKRAVESIQSKLGRDIGDSDDDGRWTIIARVTGKTGRMMQKKQAEGDIVEKGSGDVVGKYTVDYADPVDAPIIEIVAARCGPLAVGQDVGMAKEDGSIGSP